MNSTGHLRRSIIWGSFGLLLVSKIDCDRNNGAPPPTPPPTCTVLVQGLVQGPAHRKASCKAPMPGASSCKALARGSSLCTLIATLVQGPRARHGCLRVPRARLVLVRGCRARHFPLQGSHAHKALPWLILGSVPCAQCVLVQGCGERHMVSSCKVLMEGTVCPRARSLCKGCCHAGPRARTGSV